MIGVLGGSGVYDLEELEERKEERLTTAFGEPSDAYLCGRLGGKDVCFLPRHGRGHRLMPSEINHRANIMGFKMLGADRVLSVSAVGSLREEIRPRDIVLPDQYFDRTMQSHEHTFFGGGIVAHVSFAEPGCADLRRCLAESAEGVVQASGQDTRIMPHGTYVNMEGPAFSTKAESNVYRGLGFDVIGMTSLPEAKLCREAEICYQAMAMVTDYDCWHETEEAVSVEMVIEHLVANNRLARKILVDFIPALPADRSCPCVSALADALLTPKAAIPEERKAALAPIVGKYLE